MYTNCIAPAFAVFESMISTGFEILIDVAKDEVISSATSVAGFDCNIRFMVSSKDAYFENSKEQSMALEVTGAGCGVGEWLGDFDAHKMDTFATNDRGRNVSKCVCSVGYFRDYNGWCTACVKGKCIYMYYVYYVYYIISTREKGDVSYCGMGKHTVVMIF